MGRGGRRGKEGGRWVKKRNVQMGSEGGDYGVGKPGNFAQWFLRG